MQIALDIFLFLFYLTITLYLFALIWRFWLMYANQKSLNKINTGSVLMEVRLPREIFKSPEAMEMVANTFLQGGGVGTWFARNWNGALPTFFSLEIASTEGYVGFYVRAEKKFQQLITNNLYSQYPGIEVKVVDDYTKNIYYDHRSENISIWGINFKTKESFTLPKSDKGPRSDYFKKIQEEKDDKKKSSMKDKLKVPADFRMFKTYVDYKQDKDPKEEFEHDPLTPILEWLGSLGPGEHGWYQLLLQDTGKWNDKAFPKTYSCDETHEHFSLRDLADERLKQIRTKEGGIKYKKGDKIFDEYGYPRMRKVEKGKDSNGNPIMIDEQMTYQKDVMDDDQRLKDTDLTEELRDEVKMINRKMQKPVLRAALRVVYIAKKEVDNFSPNIQSTLSLFRQYTAPGFNDFIPNPTDPYDYSWENTKKRRTPWRGEEIFEEYVEREAFYPHLEDRASAKNVFTKFILFGHGPDWFADVYLFKWSMRVRKLVRLMYEGFFHPFHHPHSSRIFTLNLEEVASFWHLPGSVATTPGIKRIDSLRGDAPTNLPR